MEVCAVPLDSAHVIFTFFCLGFAGWLAETINETITRKKFVNKGFFKGPFALSHAIGGVFVYIIGNPLRENPLLVFFAGMIVCTVIEYIMAVFLDTCFGVKCWDYRTYPHTRWCHLQGRVCLTISLFFGSITLFVVYLFWDFTAYIAACLGAYLIAVDAVFITAFLFDVITTCARILKAKKSGEKVKGYAVFSDPEDIE
jgi:uncharacterized membrane protein